MAITVVGSVGFEIEAGSSTEAISIPGTLAQNDIVQVAVCTDDEIASPVAAGTGGIASGQSYTDIYFSVDGSGSKANPGHHVAYKRMGGSPDSTVTINQVSAKKQAGTIYVLRGVDTTTALDATPTHNALNSNGAPDPPSITTVTANAMVVVIGLLDDDDVASSVTAPSGYTNLIAGDTAQGSTSVGATSMVASKIIATAGVEAPAAFGGGLSDNNRTITVAYRPSADSVILTVAEASHGHTVDNVELDAEMIIVAAKSAFEIEIGSGSESISLPGTPAADDIVLITLAGDEAIPDPTVAGTGGISEAAGYTNILHDPANSNPGTHIAYKRMGGSPDTTVSIHQTTKKQAGVIYLIRGVDPTTALDVAATTATQTGADGAPDPPSITPTNDNCLIVICGTVDDDDVASGVTAPSGYDNLIASDCAAGGPDSSGATAMMAAKILGTAGATDPAAFSLAAGADRWAAATIAFRLSSASVQLASAETVHAHEAENAVLTSALLLTVADGASAHAVDNVALTQDHNLVLADGTSAHAADGVALTQKHNLVLADALHAHGVDNITLGTLALLIADTLHAHGVDNIVLSGAAPAQLVVADALHEHVPDHITLSGSFPANVAKTVRFAVAISVSL